MKLLDTHAQVTKAFSFALPESANGFSLLNEYYTGADGVRNFLFYVHHFTGNGGPEDQVHSIFVVNENGEIIRMLDGSSARVVAGGDTAKLMVFNDTENDMIVTNYNTVTLEAEESMTVPFELINYMAGNVVNFLTVKEQPSLVLAHYEKVFMDNDTFEMYPGNHLVVGIDDMQLNLQKKVLLDITSAYPEEPYNLPMAEFGMFYNYGKYEITDHTFNSDDALEFMYSISYFDLMGDKTWNHYFVGNEAGERIPLLEYDIVGSAPLQELSGQQDQVALYIGEGDFVSALRMFNIPEWKTAYTFNAVHQDQLLTLNLNRIPAAEGYDYLIALPDIEESNGDMFGYINRYSAQGAYLDQTALRLGADAISFTPQLFTEAINPHLYQADAAREFSYATRHASKGATFKKFRIARNADDILFEIQGDGDKGNLVGSHHLSGEAGQVNQLTLLYTTGNYFYTVDFYDLPFAVLGTEESSAEKKVQVYYDPTRQLVKWDAAAYSAALYRKTGLHVRTQTKSDSMAASGLAAGVYVLVVQLEDGHQVSKKVLIR